MKFSHVLAAALLTLLATPAVNAATHTLTKTEETLFELIKDHPNQNRTTMKLDPILCKVARARAKDLARRAYFDHVNPDGVGPNFLVKKAGFFLPSFYDPARDANNIESIAARSPRGSAQQGLTQWLNSVPHKRHILAEIAFNKAQTAIGVGIFNSTTAPFDTYYVFLSAPRNRNRNPPLVVLKASDGTIIDSTR